MTQGALIGNHTRYESCPLCFSERIEPVGRIPYESPTRFSTSEVEFAAAPQLWRCKDCGSSFVQNVVPEDIAVTLYTGGASGERWSSEPFEVVKPANQLECLDGYFREGASVLDIGCNTGELLDYARRRGCRTAGVEYSAASRRILETKGHDSFANISDVDEQFDVITAFDLVEHFYDVPDFFRRCKAMLKKGGVLVVLTGDIGSLSARVCKANWWYLRYPEHIAFPSRKYFARHSGLVLDRWLRTYASKGYQAGWVEILRQLASGLVKRRYSGLPSIGPDHVMAVLKNEG
jgi:SAM-dependent methyltransferase